MNWNKHLREVPEGAHAFLGASKYAWTNYDDEKLISTYRNHLATIKGTRYHALASELISLGQRLPRVSKTLNMYVNDAISMHMETEQALYFSDKSFGRADAISFKEKSGLLRIHDLKTGTTPASLRQLEVYSALFCLEYGPLMNFKPGDIQFELAIYQNDDILFGYPKAPDIVPIMDKIIRFDRILTKIDEEEEE